VWHRVVLLPLFWLSNPVRLDLDIRVAPKRPLQPSNLVLQVRRVKRRYQHPSNHEVLVGSGAIVTLSAFITVREVRRGHYYDLHLRYQSTKLSSRDCSGELGIPETLHEALV
jgi:hypothetical protein